MNSRNLHRFVMLAALLCLAAGSVHGATCDYYLKIDGAKQGKFKGDATRAGQRDWIRGCQFSYVAGSPRDVATGQVSGKVVSPRDVATGQASGKRQHESIVIVKEWGAASPQIAQAMNTGEVLTSVRMEFARPGAGGAEMVYKTLELTNATIISVRRLPGGSGQGLEEVSFTFQKIEARDKNGKTMAMDDWMK
jgi:type VI secretion system secreted protein Hcp